MLEFGLKGKRALICGGSQGIGAATALSFAQAGAEVVLLARNAAKLETVLAQLPATPEVKHSCLAVDLADHEALEQALAGLPPVYILVNNAGGPAPGPLAQAEIAQFIAAFQPHLYAAQILLQGLLPGMKTLGYGRIINIISTSVKQPIANLGVSNTVRGAMASWAKTLAGELGSFGITVNNVLPGFTATERLEYLIAQRAKNQGLSQTDIAQAMMAEVPLRRFAQPEEVAAAILFLASPAAAYINGINLPVDGGRLQTL